MRWRWNSVSKDTSWRISETINWLPVHHRANTSWTGRGNHSHCICTPRESSSMGRPAPWTTIRLYMWVATIYNISFKMNLFDLECPGNTNGAWFEFFALLGKIYGLGLPLGYLLIQSNIREPGAKEQFISCFISYIHDHWDLQIIFTLTDKDWSEINYFLATIPDAKHQLCYWHAIWAVKSHLSILWCAPGPYNVKVAKVKFDWIDESFIPINQSGDQVSFGYYCW